METKRISYTYNHIISYKYHEISDFNLNISDSLYNRLKEKNIIKKDISINTIVRQFITININKLSEHNLLNTANLFFNTITTEKNFDLFIELFHIACIDNTKLLPLYVIFCSKISSIYSHTFWGKFVDHLLSRTVALFNKSNFKKIDKISKIIDGSISLDELDKYNKEKDKFIANIYLFIELYNNDIIGNNKIKMFLNKTLSYNNDLSIYYSILLIMNIVKKNPKDNIYLKSLEIIKKTINEKSKRTQFLMKDLEELIKS